MTQIHTCPLPCFSHRLVGSSHVLRWLMVPLLVLTMVGSTRGGWAQRLTEKDLQAIGDRIWQNESAGKLEGLTAWNAGENFASMGIGHFIWYPDGEAGPFEESFPPLLQHLKRNGVRLPAWLDQIRKCPWPNRTIFLRERQSTRMVELRLLMASTQALQVTYIIERLERTLPKFRTAAGKDGDLVLANVSDLRRTKAGTFALIDYINFKGDGLNPSERYKGEGWGLLQVLAAMEPSGPQQAPTTFANAAKSVMSRRVENSPPERQERRWHRGWQNRCASYGNFR